MSRTSHHTTTHASSSASATPTRPHSTPIDTNASATTPAPTHEQMPPDDNFELVDYVSQLDHCVVVLGLHVRRALDSLHNKSVSAAGRASTQSPTTHSDQHNARPPRVASACDPQYSITTSHLKDPVPHAANANPNDLSASCSSQCPTSILNDTTPSTSGHRSVSRAVYHGTFEFENIHYTLQLSSLCRDARLSPLTFPDYVDPSAVLTHSGTSAASTAQSSLVNASTNVQPQHLSSSSTATFAPGQGNRASGLGFAAGRYATLFADAIHALTDTRSSVSRVDNLGNDFTTTQPTVTLAPTSISTTTDTQHPFRQDPHGGLVDTLTRSISGASSSMSRSASVGALNDNGAIAAIPTTMSATTMPISSSETLDSRLSALHRLTCSPEFFVVTPVGDEQQLYSRKNTAGSWRQSISSSKKLSASTISPTQRPESKFTSGQRYPSHLPNVSNSSLLSAGMVHSPKPSPPRATDFLTQHEINDYGTNRNDTLSVAANIFARDTPSTEPKSVLMNAFKRVMTDLGSSIPIFFVEDDDTLLDDLRGVYFLCDGNSKDYENRDECIPKSIQSVKFHITHLTLNVGAFASCEQLLKGLEIDPTNNDVTMSQTLTYFTQIGTNGSQTWRKFITDLDSTQMISNTNWELPWGPQTDPLDAFSVTIHFPNRTISDFIGWENGSLKFDMGHKICRHGNHFSSQMRQQTSNSISDNNDNEGKVASNALRYIYPSLAGKNADIDIVVEYLWKELDMAVLTIDESPKLEEGPLSFFPHISSTSSNHTNTKSIRVGKDTPILSSIILRVLRASVDYLDDLTNLQNSGKLCIVGIEPSEFIPPTPKKQIIHETQSNQSSMAQQNVSEQLDNRRQLSETEPLVFSSYDNDVASSNSNRELSSISGVVGDTLSFFKTGALPSVLSSTRDVLSSMRGKGSHAESSTGKQGTEHFGLGNTNAAPQMTSRLGLVDTDDIQNCVDFIRSNSNCTLPFLKTGGSLTFDANKHPYVCWDAGVSTNSLLYRFATCLLLVASPENPFKYDAGILPMFRGIWENLLIKLEADFRQADLIPNVPVTGLNPFSTDLRSMCLQQPTIDQRRLLVDQKLQMLNICIFEMQKRRLLRTLSRRHDDPQDGFSRHLPDHKGSKDNTCPIHGILGVSVKSNHSGRKRELAETAGEVGQRPESESSLNVIAGKLFPGGTRERSTPTSVAIPELTESKMEMNSHSSPKIPRQGSKSIHQDSTQSSGHPSKIFMRGDSYSQRASYPHSLDSQSWSSDRSWQDLVTKHGASNNVISARAPGSPSAGVLHSESDPNLFVERCGGNEYFGSRRTIRSGSTGLQNNHEIASSSRTSNEDTTLSRNLSKRRKESFGSDNKKDVELTEHDLFYEGMDWDEDANISGPNISIRRSVSAKVGSVSKDIPSSNSNVGKGDIYSTSAELTHLASDMGGIRLTNQSAAQSLLISEKRAATSSADGTGAFSATTTNWGGWEYGSQENEHLWREHDSNEALNMAVAVPSTLGQLSSGLSPSHNPASSFQTNSLSENSISSSDVNAMGTTPQLQPINDDQRARSHNHPRLLSRGSAQQGGEPRSSSINISQHRARSGSTSKVGSIGISASSFVDIPLPPTYVQHGVRSNGQRDGSMTAGSYGMSSASPRVPKDGDFSGSSGDFFSVVHRSVGSYQKSEGFGGRSSGIEGNESSPPMYGIAKPISGLTRELKSGKGHNNNSSSSRHDPRGVTFVDNQSVNVDHHASQRFSTSPSQEGSCTCRHSTSGDDVTVEISREGHLDLLDFAASEGGALYRPITQNSTPMTGDMVELLHLEMEYMTPAERMETQLRSLRSDMEAFKAANPNAQLVDFVRWHSPRDYSDGILSARMQSGKWKEMWDSSLRVPIWRQEPLWDCELEGKRALGWLRRNLQFFDLLPAMLLICYRRLGEALYNISLFDISKMMSLSSIPTQDTETTEMQQPIVSGTNVGESRKTVDIRKDPAGYATNWLFGPNSGVNSMLSTSERVLKNMYKGDSNEANVANEESVNRNGDDEQQQQPQQQSSLQQSHKCTCQDECDMMTMIYSDDIEDVVEDALTPDHCVSGLEDNSLSNEAESAGRILVHELLKEYASFGDLWSKQCSKYLDEYVYAINARAHALANEALRPKNEEYSRLLQQQQQAMLAAKESNNATQRNSQSHSTIGVTSTTTIPADYQHGDNNKTSMNVGVVGGNGGDDCGDDDNGDNAMEPRRVEEQKRQSSKERNRTRDIGDNGQHLGDGVGGGGGEKCRMQREQDIAVAGNITNPSTTSIEVQQLRSQWTREGRKTAARMVANGEYRGCFTADAATRFAERVWRLQALENECGRQASLRRRVPRRAAEEACGMGGVAVGRAGAERRVLAGSVRGHEARVVERTVRSGGVRTYVRQDVGTGGMATVVRAVREEEEECGGGVGG